MKEYSDYSYKPFVIEAKIAHAKKIISYQKDGTSILSRKKGEKITITPAHQYALIRLIFDDLSKALSSTANSPLFENNQTLRSLFDKEYSGYEKLVASLSPTQFE